MEIRYVRKFDFLVGAAIVIFAAYVLSREVVVIAITVLLLGTLIFLERRKKIVFSEHDIFFKDSMFKKGISTNYSTLKKVRVSKVYSTTYYDMIVKFTFDINGKKRISKLNLYDNTLACKLIQFLRRKNIACEYGDDLIETILERKMNMEK